MYSPETKTGEPFISEEPIVHTSDPHEESQHVPVLADLAESMPQPSKYNLLHMQTQYRNRVFSTDETLQEYVKNTDHIVGLLDGSIRQTGSIKRLDEATFESTGRISFEKEEIENIEDFPKPDLVLWLDKSARPVSWMVRELWDQLATPEEDGKIPAKPKSLFMNIDREPWLMAAGVKVSEIDAERSNQFKINQITTSSETAKQKVGNIRGLFVDTSRVEVNEAGEEKKIVLTPENFDEEVWKMPMRTKPNGEPYEHMMIVDEVKSSGATSFISQELLSAALPEIIVTTEHWQDDMSARAVGNKPGWVPAWYNANSPYGRGVTDLDIRWYTDSSGNWLHAQAHEVLSTPIHDRKSGVRKRDVRSEELRSDMKTLAKDLGRHAILYVPARKRTAEDKKSRIQILSGMTFEEWKTHRGTAS